jgi:mono/diheme cytochrome c family protein
MGAARSPARPLGLDMPTVAWHDHEMQSMCVRRSRRSAGGGVYLLTPVLALAGLLFLGWAAASLVAAQTSTSRRTVWDGVYTEAQAARGLTAFGQNCSGCHALAAAGKAPLAGEPFWKSFAQKTVGDLLEYVSTNMPNGAPGSLNESTYRDIVAVILKSNDFPAGTTELERNTIAGVQIIPKDGNTELPANALARVVGCLARSGADWVVTNATTPERAERPASPGEDATRPLGGRTIPLKFVVTKLDSFAGSRVAVNGLLIGAGGVDGMNVTAVNRVADKCP